jgi:hypothetical protein
MPLKSDLNQTQDWIQKNMNIPKVVLQLHIFMKPYFLSLLIHSEKAVYLLFHALRILNTI